MGNGKNKILSTLAEHGHNVIPMRGSDGSLEGQLKLVERYARQMEELKDDDGIHIFESSFIDILIYTTFLYGIYSDSESDVDFEELCVKNQEKLVDLNIRLDGFWGKLEECNHGLPVIDIWNVAAEWYFEVALLDTKEHVLRGVPIEELIDGLQQGPKALEYLSKETIRVVEEYA